MLLPWPLSASDVDGTGCGPAVVADSEDADGVDSLVPSDVGGSAAFTDACALESSFSPSSPAVTHACVDGRAHVCMRTCIAATCMVPA